MRAQVARGRRLPFLGVAGVLAAAAAIVVGIVQAQPPGPPRNQSPPILLGSFQQGRTLAVSLGAWTNGPTGFSYLWQRCDPGPRNCLSVSQAGRYTLRSADVGKQVRVGIVARNARGTSQRVFSQPVSVVAFGAPVNTGAPAIQGTAPPQVGSVLSAQPGTWSGEVDMTRYQWLSCGPKGGNCAPIGGATGRQYRPRQADVGRTLRVLVTVINEAPGAQGSARALSAQTRVVVRPGPVNTAKPTISGTAAQGQTLTGANGGWTSPNGSTITFGYQWQRCNAQGRGCANIAGANQQTYVVQQADVGRRLVLVVRATNNQGSTSAASDPAAIVQGIPAGQAIPVSQVSLAAGNRLVVSSVDYTPDVLRSRAPFRLTVRIMDVEGHFVSGAQLNLTPVPFGRVAPPGAVTTDQNGFATVTLRPTAKFPLRKGFRITIFVRAIKPGDRIIAGVTAIRLTSVGINPGR